jgi:MFS family permease
MLTVTANANTSISPDPAVILHDEAKDDNSKTRHSSRFWAIIIALSLTGLLSAIEGTIITSALPTITKSLGGGSSYIWIPNAYFLASIAMLPLSAQLSDIFGRRPMLLIAVALFTLGSGLCGGASSMAMLIAARTMYVFQSVEITTGVILILI